MSSPIPPGVPPSTPAPPPDPDPPPPPPPFDADPDPDPAYAYSANACRILSKSDTDGSWGYVVEWSKGRRGFGNWRGIATFLVLAFLFSLLFVSYRIVLYRIVSLFDVYLFWAFESARRRGNGDDLLEEWECALATTTMVG